MKVIFYKPNASSQPCFILHATDADEPLPSGSGVVSKEVTDENLLEAWADALSRWHQNLVYKPRQVTQLVRKTIPQALRGEVWQLLSGCHDNEDLLESYRVLITKVRHKLEIKT